MLHRNQIAQNIVRLYSSSRLVLPSLHDALTQCNYCEQSVPCELIGKEVEELGSGVDWPSDAHPSLKPALESFTQPENSYLGKWLHLLHL